MMIMPSRMHRKYRSIELYRPTYLSHSMIGSQSVIMLRRPKCTTLGKVIVASRNYELLENTGDG